MTILEFLRNNSIQGPFVCGGKASCGKCKIRLVKHRLPISDADKRYLDSKELEDNVRLACMAEYDEDISLDDIVVLWESEEKIVSETGIVCDEQYLSEDINYEVQYGIAIDIGTTTIAACLINHTRAFSAYENTCINRGKSFGGDVISRIAAANDGKLDILQKLLVEDIRALIDKLILINKLNPANLKAIVFAGNTTMGHILLGYDCMGLGRYPFRTVSTDLYVTDGKSLLGDDRFEGASCYILPGISAFIGADIVSGLSYVNILSKDRPILFIDLGTNGEMALGCKDRILATSTAAGPAFEGVNISSGVASIPGAICDVNIRGIKDRPKIITICDKTPLGICGSGLISAIDAMRNVGLIDSDGCLIDEYFLDGYPLVGNIRITQVDIREFQKAKSAIRAGIDVLFANYGIAYRDIEKVYLAGGFGTAINTKQAVNIGLLPKEFMDITEAVGNTSLKGAIKYINNEDEAGLNEIRKHTDEIILANTEDFGEKFIEYMSF